MFGWEALTSQGFALHAILCIFPAIAALKIRRPILAYLVGVGGLLIFKSAFEWSLGLSLELIASESRMSPLDFQIHLIWPIISFSVLNGSLAFLLGCLVRSIAVQGPSEQRAADSGVEKK